MRLTVRQLKSLIRESIEEAMGDISGITHVKSKETGKTYKVGGRGRDEIKLSRGPDGDLVINNDSLLLHDEPVEDVSSEEQGALASRRAKRTADEERRAAGRKKAVLNRDVNVFGANFAAGSGWSLGPNGAAKLDPKSGDLQVTVGHGIVETIPADAFDVVTGG
jgi:hypothetical protein